MALTHYYVSPASGNDTTGNGTIGTPWATVQKALNTITRNATDGDQINVQAGGTDTLGAALTLATYGTPTAAAPLIIRGYTSAADDGGVGVISGGGSYGIINNGTGIDYLHLWDLRLTNCGGNYVVGYLKNYSSIVNCEVDGSTSSHGILVNGTVLVERCYVHDVAGHGIYVASGALVRHCYITSYGATSAHYALSLEAPNARAHFNIVRATDVDVNGIYGNGAGCECFGNIIRAAANGTGKGINVTAQTNVVIANNIIEGFSGSGGVGLAFNSAAVCALYHSNAFYNNATNVSGTPKIVGVTGNNDTLSASPFVDAANGDFDINGTQAGVTEDAWPSSFLGATSTTPKVDKGASQAGAGSGGVLRRVLRLMGG